MCELMRILITVGRYRKSTHLLVHMIVRMAEALDKRKSIVVRLVLVDEGNTRDELMRLGDFVDRFKMPVACDERKALLLVIGARGRNCDILCVPSRPGERTNTPTRRNPMLEYFARYQSVAVINSPHITVVMVVMPLMAVAGSERHPTTIVTNLSDHLQRNCDNGDASY